MKTITIKKTLILSFVLSSILFSCQKEEIVETPTGNSELDGKNAKNDASIIPGMYIIQFSDEFIPSGKSIYKGKEFTDRAQKGRLFLENEKNVIEKINVFLKKNEISLKSVTAYYASAISGVAIKLSDEQAEKLKGIKEISSINNDRTVKMEDAKVESTTKVASPFFQYTTCANTNAGGFVNSSSSYAWIWVIDSGIDLTHPDLNVITSPSFAKTFVAGTVDADDCNGHGTHVAGIAAAKNNDFGVVGIAAGAPVVPVRVFDCTGGSAVSTIIAAINHVATYDIAGDVANLSLSGYYGSFFCSTFSAYIASLNALATTTKIAIAAGNNASSANLYEPACINGTNVFTVASMRCDKNFNNDFSNYGRNTVDYIATGDNVYSTYKDGGYATLSGTSMATPVVAGIMLARNATPAIGGWVYYNSEYYPIAVK
jgi:Subtilase family/Peptidase inhibitor I9